MHGDEATRDGAEKIRRSDDHESKREVRNGEANTTRPAVPGQRCINKSGRITTLRDDEMRHRAILVEDGISQKWVPRPRRHDEILFIEQAIGEAGGESFERSDGHIQAAVI